MDYKPNDLFVSVIDFFGIIVPGAVFLFLHGDAVVGLLGIRCIPDDRVVFWVGFLVGSLLLGHFLTGTGILLLNWAYRLRLGT